MERQCLCCHTRFTPLRNKNQRYCNKKTCQKKRRSSRQKQKLKADADYKDTHMSSQKKWRDKNPSYWRLYRSAHPLYANNNRKKQMVRDRNKPPKQGPLVFCYDANTTLFAKITTSQNLANMYSLFPKNFKFSYSCVGILLSCKYVLDSRRTLAALS